LEERPIATQIKVCGITRPEDAQRALALGADYIGVIVYAKSPRRVALEAVSELLEAIPPGKRVLVDVSTPTDQLETYRDLGFDHYQIHFDLEVSIATVAAWAGLAGPGGLWLAPRIPPSEAYFPQVLMEFADTILCDSYSKSAFGGTGHTGDWQRFSDWTLLYQHKNWILAGGLHPGNIREALRVTGADIVDVNSGVESAPGLKDGERLKRFFEEVRAHDQTRETDLA
jgi:phosphoribosylanthranilate isomerase